MSQATKREGPSFILMVAPLALLLLGYGYLFHTPQQRELQRQRRRQQTLGQQESQTQSDLTDARYDLAQTKKAIRTSEDDLKLARETQQSLYARRAALRQEVLVPTSPAATMREVARLLERHGLTVVESQPTQGASADADDVLKPLADLLAEDSESNNQRIKSGRELYRVKLSGAFANLQQALDRLATEQPLVLLLAIEMQESDPRGRMRSWYLTLMV